MEKRRLCIITVFNDRTAADTCHGVFRETVQNDNKLHKQLVKNNLIPRVYSAFKMAAGSPAAILKAE